MPYLRWIKILLVAQVGLFAALVAINNVTDYGSNFSFVQHVLTMDTTFEGNSLMWRAIASPTLHHIFYALIITAEAAAGLLCLYGAWVMLKSVNRHSDTFTASKRIASIGIFVGISLWSTGFMTVGAEWFLMWQSDSWNGQSAAFRFIMILFATLIFLHMPEAAEEASV